MLTLDALAALTGADPHPARPDDARQGECPVCGRRRYLEALPFEDGTALVRCLAGCDSREILTALRVSESDVRLDEELSGFEVTHALDLGDGGDPLSGEVLTVSGLAALPAPEPLIENTLDLRTTALLAGFHGTGKSFVALDWAASIASGAPWMGRAVRAGRVLYVVGEGAHGISQRLRAWEADRGVEIPDRNLVTLPRAVPFRDAVEVDVLAAHVARERYSLVILDTLARAAVGLDENSAEDMGRFVDAVDRVRRATPETSALLVHHMGKDRATVRGSSSLEAAMDTVYTTSADPVGLRLARTKRKDGPTADLHLLSLDEVEVEEGVSSVVLHRLGEDEEETAAEKVSGPNRERAWVAIRQVWGEFVISRHELRRHLVKETGIPEGSVARTINELKKMGALDVVSREGEPERYRPDARQATKVGLPDVKPFDGLKPGEGPSTACLGEALDGGSDASRPADH